jgi:hypothetical protein
MLKDLSYRINEILSLRKDLDETYYKLTNYKDYTKKELVEFVTSYENNLINYSNSLIKYPGNLEELNKCFGFVEIPQLKQHLDFNKKDLRIKIPLNYTLEELSINENNLGHLLNYLFEIHNSKNWILNNPKNLVGIIYSQRVSEKVGFGSDYGGNYERGEIYDIGIPIITTK